MKTWACVVLVAAAATIACDETPHGRAADAGSARRDSAAPLDQGTARRDGDSAANSDGPAAPAEAGAADGAAPAVDGGGPLPAHFLAGYNEMWGSPLMPSAMPAHYTVLYHAFATIAADGAAVDLLQQAGSPAAAALAAEYAARRLAGQPTILSVGGAGGSQNNLSATLAQDRFMATIAPLINFYGFAGVDWDIEQDAIAGATDSIVRLSRLLRQQFGADFIISMAPYGDATVAGVYKAAARQLQQTGDLSFVGFQFYNAQEPSTASVLAELQSWVDECGITPAQFVIGMWYGPWDWPAGFTFAHAKMVTIWNGVRAVHPTIRGMYTWGIRSTDEPAGYPFAKTLGPLVNVP